MTFAPGMDRKVKVYMGVTSTGTRSDTQCYALREMAALHSDIIEFVYPKDPAYRIFHDFARNEVTEEFLASDCDVLWFIDSDIVPAFKVLDLIRFHYDKWIAAGACYPIFMPIPGSNSHDPMVQFTAYKGMVEGQGISLAPVPRVPHSKGPEFVDGLATGCMFLKREVFKDLQKPYFEFKYDPITRRMIEGEDLGFCVKLNKLGIQFMTDFSMVCKHYKQVCLLDVNNYAIDMSNAKLLDYDAEIRTQVKGAVAAAYQKGRMEMLAEIKAAGVAENTATAKISKGGLILPNHF